MYKKTHSAMQLAGVRVLIVEDAPDNRLLICRILQNEGAHVTAVCNGLEAIASALSGDFEAVLMDIQMSEMDGYEATAQLRDKGYAKPIIAFTAHAMKEDETRARASGFNDYLSKPVNREKLIETILRWSRTEVPRFAEDGSVQERHV